MPQDFDEIPQQTVDAREKLWESTAEFIDKLDLLSDKLLVALTRDSSEDDVMTATCVCIVAGEIHARKAAALDRLIQSLNNGEKENEVNS